MIGKEQSKEIVYLPKVGGSVLNVAIALSRLGSKTALLSGVSNDFFGAQIERTLIESNVDTHLLIRSNHPTTLAFANLKNGTASYTFFDENSATRLLSIDELPELSDDINALQCGGISLISEPCGYLFERFIERSANDIVVSFDPNIRPSFVGDEKSYRKRINRIINIADIVKVSLDDFRWLYPDKELDNVIDEWIEKGVSIVVITQDADGAMAVTQQHKLTLAAKKVTVVDSVGAGDSFNAAFLHNLSINHLLDKQQLKTINKQALEQALSFAIKAAAITISRAGASPPWSDEII